MTKICSADNETVYILLEFLSQHLGFSKPFPWLDIGQVTMTQGEIILDDTLQLLLQHSVGS